MESKELSGSCGTIYIPIFRFNRAGGFRVLSKLASEFGLRGVNVKFVCYHHSELPYYPTTAGIVWVDEKGRLKTENTLLLTERKKDMIKGSIGLIRYLRANTSKKDVVMASFSLTALPVFFAPSKRKFYYIQAYEPEMFTSKSLVTRLLRIFAWASYLLPFTRVVNADLYLKYKNIRAKHVVPPGIDLEVFYPKKEHQDVVKDEIVIGCIGRTAEWKGANDVARAVLLLRKKGVKVRFQVAFHEVLMEGDQYDLVVPDGDENLADFYRGLDVLIAPGHIQLGAVHYPVVEAMACNTTVITTGYYPANEENAYIVPVKNPEEIANQVMSIMNNYDKAKEKRRKALKAVQQMSWELVSNKFLNIIDKSGK